MTTQLTISSNTYRLLQHDLKAESDSITSIASIPNMTSCDSSDNVNRDFHIWHCGISQYYTSYIFQYHSQSVDTDNTTERDEGTNDQFTNKIGISVIYSY